MKLTVLPADRIEYEAFQFAVREFADYQRRIDDEYRKPEAERDGAKLERLHAGWRLLAFDIATHLDQAALMWEDPE